VICPETGKESDSKWLYNGEVLEYELPIE